MRRLLIGVAALIMIGCSGLKEPPSPIVQKAEACGAGDLSTTSPAAVQDWFGRHRDCAVAVDGMCKPVREKATAQWTDSTEGRVCTAARNIAQWVRKPSNDHETFQSGWK
jgi:hypothetical protein